MLPQKDLNVSWFSKDIVWHHGLQTVPIKTSLDCQSKLKVRLHVTCAPTIRCPQVVLRFCQGWGREKPSQFGVVKTPRTQRVAVAAAVAATTPGAGLCGATGSQYFIEPSTVIYIGVSCYYHLQTIYVYLFYLAAPIC